ncbi:hypothetical protein Tco_1254266 [Tanacetum coccineum]
MVQEITKKQKVEEDNETAELKQLMKIIPDEEEVAIDAIPLVVKSPSIIGWKIYKEGRKSYYQIMRADGKSQMYTFFSQVLKSFNREDLEDLYKLVKAKYESTRPVEDLDLLLWGDLKTIFEPHVEDKIYMLVEKKYPLAPLTLLMMLEKNLMIDYEMNVVFDGAFGGVGDEEVVVGEGVVVISSSLDMLTNSCLGGIMVSLIFLEGLDEEALVEFMVDWCEEDEDDDKSGEGDLFN